jgi:hypothetical protein
LSLIAWRRRKTRLDPLARTLDICARGAPERTVVQGTGDRGSIAFSVLLRPPRGARPGLLPSIATFCASEGARKDTGIITWTRWPDEIVSGGRVLASTTVTRGSSRGRPWVILTFRFNRGPVDQHGSTSLDELLGVEVDPDLLVAKVLDSLAWMHAGWVGNMTPQLLARISSMIEGPDRRVVVNQGGREVPGITSRRVPVESTERLL